jgi:hypothetical protein
MVDGASIFRKIIATLPVFLTVAGTIMNLLTIRVCLTKNLRKNPTFVFLAFIAAAEIPPLYFFTLESFIMNYFNLIIFDVHVFYCKAAVFFYGSGRHIAAWLLVRLLKKIEN